MATETVVDPADFGMADLSCDITNCRAILELSLSAFDSGIDYDKTNAVSALYGLLGLMRKVEAESERIERAVQLSQGALTPGQGGSNA